MTTVRIERRRPGLPVAEDDVQATFLDTAKTCGWLVVHFRPARTERGWRTPLSGHKGFVDCVVARAGVVYHVEFKGYRGRLEPEQEDWRDALGDSWRLVGPDQLDDALAALVSKTGEWPA